MVDTLTLHPADRTWHVLRERAVMSRDEFDSLRVVTSPWGGPARTQCRAMIGGRWHAVERQYSFGCPMFFANPITIRLKAGEL